MACNLLKGQQICIIIPSKQLIVQESEMPQVFVELPLNPLNSNAINSFTNISHDLSSTERIDACDEIIVPDILTPVTTEDNLKYSNSSNIIPPEIESVHTSDLQKVYLEPKNASNEQFSDQQFTKFSQVSELPFIMANNTDLQNFSLNSHNQTEFKFNELHLSLSEQNRRVPESCCEYLNLKEELVRKLDKILNKADPIIQKEKYPNTSHVTIDLPSTSEQNNNTSKTKKYINLSETTGNNICKNREIIVDELKRCLAKKPKDIDLGNLKCGIIEASRSVTKTAKSLKLLSKVIKGDTSLQKQEALKHLKVFRNILKDFQNSVTVINRSVRNHYEQFTTSAL